MNSRHTQRRFAAWGAVGGFALMLAFGLRVNAQIGTPDGSSAAEDVRADGISDDGVPEGWMIIEGDIMVPETMETGGGHSTNLWPGGVVPYEFEPGLSAYRQAMARSGMDAWARVANLTFVPRTNENDRIYFVDANGNSSPIGRQGGRQTIRIYNWDNQYIIAHEVGHSLGFYHEQSRMDRDGYVRINQDNITDGNGFNFDYRGEGGDFGPYDFDSVMHYGKCAFSKCCGRFACECPDNCTTIDVQEPYFDEWQDKIGQREHLSQQDGRVASFMYPTAGSVFVDPFYTDYGNQQGTFLHPYVRFDTGMANTPAGGTLWLLAPGNYGYRGTWSSHVTIQAGNGPVVIGSGAAP